MYARVVSTSKKKADIIIICEDEAMKGPHCGFCSASGADAKRNRKEIVLADNPVGAAPGNIVELGLDEHAELKAALILFVLPIVLFIGVLAVTAELGLSLWESAAWGLGSLAGTFLVLKLALKQKTYYRIERIK